MLYLCKIGEINNELKGFVSEVGYIHKIEEGKYGIKYYSSEREVNFCGHATIALMYELFKTDKELENKELVKIITNDGELIVENRTKSDDAVFVMSPPPKEQVDIPDLEDIAVNLNIVPGVINKALPIKIINAGLRTLIVPINTLDSMWNKDMVILEQNNKIDKYNIIKLQKKKDQDDNERIIFGGGAIKRIDGEYNLYTE